MAEHGGEAGAGGPVLLAGEEHHLIYATSIYDMYEGERGAKSSGACRTS